jgi:hypothetical protein
LGTEEHLRSLLEPTLKETQFPLGTDVKVSRVSIEDFDECESDEYNDCSTFATCSNTQVLLDGFFFQHSQTFSKRRL